MKTHNLFSYGTLQQDNVQLENYGRILQGEKDVLHGYKLGEVEITDAEVLQKSEKQFHPIAIKTNNPKDTIEGTIFQITEEELIQSDAYEVDDYVRVSETFASGKTAWIYVEKH